MNNTHIRRIVLITKIQPREFTRIGKNDCLYTSSKDLNTGTNTLPQSTPYLEIPSNCHISFNGFLSRLFSSSEHKYTQNPFSETSYEDISAPAIEIIQQVQELAESFGHNEINHYHIMLNAVNETLDFIGQYEAGELGLRDVSHESGVGYFKDCFTSEIFEKDEYREKFKEVLKETQNSLNEKLSQMPQAHVKEPKFADTLVKDIVFEKSTYSTGEDSVQIIDGFDIYTGTFNTNTKELKNFVKDLDMKIYSLYQVEDSSDKNRIHFPNYDDKAEKVISNLNKGTNMFITYDDSKIEPNSFVPSVIEAFKHSTGRFNPDNTEIIELNKNISMPFLIDKVNALRKDNTKNYILMFSQQDLIKNDDLDLSFFNENSQSDTEYTKIFKNTPPNVGLIVFDTKDSYLTALSKDVLFKAMKDTAEISIPVLTKEDVYNALSNSSYLKDNGISISKEALEKAVDTSTQMEGIFPEKTLYLLKKISQYYIDKSGEVKIGDVNEFIKESEHIFKKTGNESSIEIVFDTGKTLDDIVGKYNTKKEAENIVRQIKDNAIGTKGFLIYSQDGSVGAGRRHTAEVIAGEAKIPFVSINSMDFGTKDVDLFGGSAVSPEVAIRKLFSLVSTQAETNSHKAAVLFIEKFEYFSIGEMLSSEYHQKAMAQLIREMTNAGNKGLNIVVIGSVSDPSLLGDATTESFKFNNTIEVSSPMHNQSEREAILRYMIEDSSIKLAGSKANREELIQTMAKTLGGFSYIDLKNFVQKALSVATERGHKQVRKEDMIESYMRITTGRPNLDSIPKHEKELTTKHECGHAVTLQVMNNLMHKCGKDWMVPNAVNFITLDPRANYAGAMYHISDTNTRGSFENIFIDIICSYGGHSAEKAFYGMDGSWGITGDLDSATSTAEEMVTAMGMGYKTGKRSLANVFNEENFQRNITPKLREKIEDDVEVITRNALTASDMIVEYYADFINEFADKYADKVGTGDCLIDGDQFRKELAAWKAKQSPNKCAELEVLDNILLDIIAATKKGKLY